MARVLISNTNKLVLISNNTLRIYFSPYDTIYKEVSVNGCLTAAQFSPCGKYFAAASEDKLLHVWKLDGECEQISTRKLSRRGHRISFSSQSKHILVGDRGGDVVLFPTLDNQDQGQIILGHISMLLDMTLSTDDKYVITADRDEKIRVYNFPNAYNIHTFCLGHKEFVSHISTLPCCPHWIVSASGDGTLRLWDFEGSGKEISKHSYIEDIPIEQEERADDHLPLKRLLCTANSTIIIFPEDSLHCATYQIKEKALVLSSTFSLDKEKGLLWDACLDPTNHLWVLQEHGMSVFLIHPDGMVDQASKTQPLANFLSHISDSWDFSKDCKDKYVTGPLKLLYKHSYDNQSDYYQRKKERLEKKAELKKIKLEAATTETSPPVNNL